MRAGEVFRGTLERLDRAFTVELLASAPEEGEGILKPPVRDDDIVSAARRNAFARVLVGLVHADGAADVHEIAQVELRTGRITGRRPVSAADLLAAETPIGEGIECLAERPFYLVLRHRKVTGILTRADFNKLPVKTYLNTLLVRLEAVLDEAVEKEWPDGGWLRLLSADQRLKISDLFERRQRQDREIPLLSCAQLPDKFVLGRRIPGLNGVFKEAGGRRRDVTDEILALRNDLAHGRDPVRGSADDAVGVPGNTRGIPSGGIAKLRSQVDCIRALIDRVSDFCETSGCPPGRTPT